MNTIHHQKLTAMAQLTESERLLVNMIRHLGFGRILNLQICKGVPSFRPAPTVVRVVKFPTDQPIAPQPDHDDFLLKRHVADLFTSTRAANNGIARVEVRHGLPVLLEIELCGDFESVPDVTAYA